MTLITTTQADFLAEDVRRRRSDEVDLGGTWRDGSSDSWTLSWLRETGELYLVRNDSAVGAASTLIVLAVVASETDLDARLDGWRDARDREDGLTWLRGRLQLPDAA